MHSPVVSVIMPTLNSARTLRVALASVREQDTLPGDVEVLVVDGGSSDETRAIARQYGCLVLDNPKVLPEYAKSLGLQSARGRYAVFLDSDEELTDRRSLSKKIRLLDTQGNVHSVITAGLATPEGFGVVSDYANRFGDPFSFFMYRLDGGDYIPSFRSRAQTLFEDDESIVFRFDENSPLPICDGGGHFFRLEYLRAITDLSNVAIVSQVFPLMASEHRQLAVIKGDFVRHYSTASFRGLLRKIDWRIVGNIHYADTGATGYSARERSQPAAFSRKKFLFMPYALSVVGPIFDAIVMSIKYRHAGFLLHAPASIYAALDIILNVALRHARVRPRWREYGG